MMMSLYSYWEKTNHLLVLVYHHQTFVPYVYAWIQHCFNKKKKEKEKEMKRNIPERVVCCCSLKRLIILIQGKCLSVSLVKKKEKKKKLNINTYTHTLK